MEDLIAQSGAPVQQGCSMGLIDNGNGVKRRFGRVELAQAAREGGAEKRGKANRLIV